MARLTEAQRRALEAMPFSYMTWGGKLATRLPEGIRSRTVLENLRSAGLATCKRNAGTTTWDRTPAGRLALKGADRDG